jgi:transposase
MSATHTTDSTTPSTPVLYLAFELGWTTWKLAFTIGAGQPPRIRSIPARNTVTLMLEIQKAKQRFGLPEDAAVISCYEAGRDGFWLHRFLVHEGVKNLVVDSASIEVNRRKRRAKSDRLDAIKLVSMLIRWHQGEKRVWAVVHVPTADDEDRRQFHRELIRLKAQRTRHDNRIKGLLAGLGLSVVIDARLPERLGRLRQWDGQEVPPGLRRCLVREWERRQLVGRQIRELEAERREQIRHGSDPQMDQVRRLLRLRAIGPNTAWLLVHEVFAWRQIRNRRELGSLAGLTPSPYDSGQSRREQGVSKAGNRRVRWMMIELAWLWLRYQPSSELSQWFRQRFGPGNSRVRKVGIVALARKLLVALWKYLETGDIPAGAEVKVTKAQKDLGQTGDIPAGAEAKVAEDQKDLGQTGDIPAGAEAKVAEDQKDLGVTLKQAS